MVGAIASQGTVCRTARAHKTGQDMKRAMRLRETVSGLDVAASLLDDLAPENAGFLWDYLAGTREVPAIHAMWTGPEISAPIPLAQIDQSRRGRALPLEHATIQPQAGDVVLSWLAPRVWGGGPDPVFDLGLFYAPGGRTLFPIGWVPGSVVARVDAAFLPAVAAACGRIRQRGACTLILERAG